MDYLCYISKLLLEKFSTTVRRIYPEITAHNGNCFLLFAGHRRSVSRSPPRRYEAFLTGLYQPEMASSADCFVENPQISRT